MNGFTLDPAIGEFIMTHPDVSTEDMEIKYGQLLIRLYRSNCLLVARFTLSMKETTSTLMNPAESMSTLSSKSIVHVMLVPWCLISTAHFCMVRFISAHATTRIIVPICATWLANPCYVLPGGIFGYPADAKSKRGKLRILYEVFPMAFLIEQAGGKASTGTMDALDIIPEHIHDRSGIWLGSKEDVEDVVALYKQHQ